MRLRRRWRRRRRGSGEVSMVVELVEALGWVERRELMVGLKAATTHRE